MRRTNRALLAVDALAFAFGVAAAVVTIGAVARGFTPALLLALAAVIPLILWSLRDGALEIKLWRALNRSPK